MLAVMPIEALRRWATAECSMSPVGFAVPWPCVERTGQIEAAARLRINKKLKLRRNHRIICRLFRSEPGAVLQLSVCVFLDKGEPIYAP
jgi:predicted signal transduction protein with EAL and GGDEF domain